MDERIPKTFYHYCSPATFVSIVKNRSIWLSDISKSNDSKELHWIVEQFDEYLYSSPFADIVSRSPFFKRILRRFEGEALFKCWALCLSEKKDDLGQWRGYAKDGTGVSIGFNQELLKSIFQGMPRDEKKGVIFRFERIKYGRAAVRKMFDEEMKKSDAELKINKAESVLLDTMMIALSNSPFFKGETFRQEKEWRLAALLTKPEVDEGARPDDVNFLDPSLNSLKYEYNEMDGDIVSHLELYCKNLPEQVAEIRLGPKCKWSVEETKLFLVSVGWLKDINDRSIKIIESQSSYR